MYYCYKCNKDLQLNSGQFHGVCELCGTASDIYLIPKQPLYMNQKLFERIQDVFLIKLHCRETWTRFEIDQIWQESKAEVIAEEQSS